MDAWLIDASRDFECSRMSAEFMDLLRLCRFEGDPIGMDYTSRFWLAVYMRASDQNTSFSALARRFRVLRSHLFAAVTLRTIPSEFQYFTPIGFIRMRQTVGLVLSENERYSLFFHLDMTSDQYE